MRSTIKATLVAKRDGDYGTLVFKNEDEPQNSWDRYITCTFLPHWQTMPPQPDIVGYLEFEAVNAGDTYTNSIGEVGTYKYTDNYFMSFTPLLSTTNTFKF